MRRLLSIWRGLSPPALLVWSFAVLILVGTAGLGLLPGLYAARPLPFLDALFTITSASCVTGLVVVDTATYFTPLGQAWVLLFIQLGGLGVVTLTTFVIGALGRRLSLRSEVIALPTIHPGQAEMTSLVLAALRFTLAIEGAGALALWVQWLPDLGAARAIWPAVFHSVSAFCNAGFSIFPGNLAGQAGRPGVLITLSLLIVVGGLGYLAVEEVLRWWRAGGRRAPRRLSTHTWTVLTTTAALLAGGAILFALFEWNGVLRPLAPVDRAVSAWFMAVAPRTAGFNVVSYARIGNETAFLTVLLMTIGGSPGSTAGGVKTTTFALVLAIAASRIRGHRHVSLHGRTVPEGTVQRTVSLLLLAFAVITAAVFLLTLAQTADLPLARARQTFLPLLFEAVSAFGTVGLSMDQTPHLTAPSKLVIVALMFLGRVGPLAFFAALAIRSAGRPAGLRAAREDVIVG